VTRRERFARQTIKKRKKKKKKKKEKEKEKEKEKTRTGVQHERAIDRHTPPAVNAVT
jgi:hypothetical protein